MNETNERERSPEYAVRLGGRVPDEVVVICGRGAGRVTFYPMGGGFQYQTSEEKFAATHRSVTEAEVRGAARPAVFDIDGHFGNLPGYTFGHRWNGWACPFFPKESCERITLVMGPGPRCRFDAATNAYILPDDSDDQNPGAVYTYAAQTILVDGREVEVWPIGNGDWTWDEE